MSQGIIVSTSGDGGLRLPGVKPGPSRARSLPPLRVAPSVADRLFGECYHFDFFQAVRLLQALDPTRAPVGHGGPPAAEAVRFRAHISLSFPPSAVHDLTRPTPARPLPEMVQSFFGLTGPSGILPRHYTELLYRLDRDARGPERTLLRDWLDLFNHRFVSLFYRAWEKYRFTNAHETGAFRKDEPDLFTLGIFSLVGLGMPPLRNRLQIVARESGRPPGRAEVLAKIEDLALIYYGGFFAHRPRNVTSLEALLRDFFQFPTRVTQFEGQWLPLEPMNQSSLCGDGGNNQLGLTAIAGETVGGVQNRIRLRLGPLGYRQFLEFLPDRAPTLERKAFFTLVHLVRLYVGPEIDFSVQLVLRAADVPECQLTGEDAGVGARLGWNTWVISQAAESDAPDAVFEGEEVYELDADLS